MCFAKLGSSDGIDFGGLGYLLSLNSLDSFFMISLDELIYSHNFNYHSENI